MTLVILVHEGLAGLMDASPPSIAGRPIKQSTINLSNGLKPTRYQEVNVRRLGTMDERSLVTVPLH